MTTAKKEVSKKQMLITFAVIFVIGLILYFTVCSNSVKELKLEATIIPGTTELTITNDNDFDWHNVDMMINPGIISNGFEYKTSTVMLAGQTYTVAYSEFANGEGVRFNPYTYKLQTIYIYCDNDNDDIPEGSGHWSTQ
jgi:hypothetical protein